MDAAISALKQAVKTDNHGPALVASFREFVIDPKHQKESWSVFAALAADMRPDQFWRLIFGIWPGISYTDHEECAALFRKYRNAHDPAFMSELNRRIWERIPEGLVVYRGQCAHKPLGLSWTVSRRIASFYGSSPTHIAPTLYETRICRKDVVCVFSETGEHEVTVFDPKTLAVARIEFIPGDADHGWAKIQAHRASLLAHVV